MCVQRYRTPSRSRSRSKSQTPPHWRQAQKRTIKLSDLEKSEEDKRQRDFEIKRREAERKKRHEDMARDSKKSFFELNQENPYKKNNESSDIEDGELADTTADQSMVANVSATTATLRKEIKFDESAVDMNALDYEDVGSDREENDDGGGVNNKNKSESMALAFGVQVKTNDSSAAVGDEYKRKINMQIAGEKEAIVKHRNKNDGRASAERSLRQRSPQRRSNFAGSNRGGRLIESRDRRQRSRSADRRSRRRSSVDRRRRRRRDSSSNDRKVRSRSRRRSRDESSRRRRRSYDRRSRSPVPVTRRRSRSTTPSRKRDDQKSKSPQTVAVMTSRIPPPPPIIITSLSAEEEREKLNKEKMMKRAVALMLLKDHMRKEIEEQEKRQAEKTRGSIHQATGAGDEHRNEISTLQLARLEQIKTEELERQRAAEEIKQLVAVKKAVEVVVAATSKTKAAREATKKSRRRSNSSSADERDSSHNKRSKRSERHKRSRKYSSSD